MATKTQRLGFLDGWRACAIIFVLIGHYLTHRGLNLGRLGVELFFVLSGRLMAEILFTDVSPLKPFVFRRFSRVYPALFFFVTVCALLLVALRPHSLTWAQYLSTVTFTSNYAGLWIGSNPVFEHIWSLCVEEHTYLLLGLLALIHRARPFPAAMVFFVIAAIAIGVGAWQTHLGWTYDQVYWRSDVRCASILLGAGCFLLLHRRAWTSAAIGWASVGLFGLALVLNLDVVPDPVKYSLGTLCLALSIALLPQASPKLLHALEGPVLLQVAAWSFSLYLWQQPFYALAGSLPRRLILLPVAIGVAIASFRLVEQPARRRLNAWLDARRSVVVG